MKLHELKPVIGSHKAKHRKGRGVAAGKGKTAGRGTNGQNARTGGGVRLGFEGGQNPWFRRIPKRGFNNVNHVEYQIVNIGSLDKKFQDGDKVDITTLLSSKLIRSKTMKVKILAQGKITKKLNVEVDSISEAALAAIVKAGGKVLTQKEQKSN